MDPTRRYQSLALMVSRSVLFRADRSALRTGLAELFKPEGAPRYRDPKERCYVAFVPGVGRLQDAPPQRWTDQSLQIEYPNSRFRHQPYYLTPNWKISLPQTLLPGIEASSLRFSLRARVHDHLTITPCFTLAARLGEGVSHPDCIRLIRGLADKRPTDPVKLSWSNRDGGHEGTVHELLTALVEATARGLGFEPGSLEIVEADINQVAIDIGQASPKLATPDDDEELSRLLMLDSHPRRTIQDGRLPSTTFYETDWLGFNSRAVLFCDTDSPWPYRPQVGRMMRRRPPLLWRLTEVVEIARIQQLWSDSLSKQFESAVVDMQRAKNQSITFLENLLKTSYYDDEALTMSMDIPHIHSTFHSNRASLYDQFSKRIGLPASLARLDVSTKAFLTHVSTWSPGIMRVLDLIKLRRI